MQARTARIRDRFIFGNAQGEIGFDKLVWHVRKAGPQRMPVRTVAYGPSGNTTEADLEELKPSPRFVIARIEEVRTVRKPCLVQSVGRSLPQHSTHNIEDAGEGMSAAAECSRIFRFEQPTFRDANIHQLIKAVVE